MSWREYIEDYAVECAFDPNGPVNREAVNDLIKMIEDDIIAPERSQAVHRCLQIIDDEADTEFEAHEQRAYLALQSVARRIRKEFGKA